MAFASNFRRFISNGLARNSLLSQVRENSTLTTPRLFVSGLSRMTTYEKLKEAFSPFGQLLEGLSRMTTDEKLKEAFSPFGQLLEANVITDRASGRSKGFGFVRYATIEDAERAQEGMNAKYLDGWVIFVDPAKPREPRPRPQPEPEPSETGFRVNKTVGWCG